MPRPIPYERRREIIRRKQAGESLSEIAEALDLSYWTVRQIWRRFRDEGEKGLQNRYRSGPRERKFATEVYQKAIQLKQEHPRWGAGLIRSLLLEQWPKEEVPSERTLQRWWEREGMSCRPKRAHSPSRPRAQEVHDAWQVDAVEVHQGTWITVTDEKSGAVLASRLFPLSKSQPDSGREDPRVLSGGV